MKLRDFVVRDPRILVYLKAPQGGGDPRRSSGQLHAAGKLKARTSMGVISAISARGARLDGIGRGRRPPTRLPGRRRPSRHRRSFCSRGGGRVRGDSTAASGTIFSLTLAPRTSRARHSGPGADTHLKDDECVRSPKAEPGARARSISRTPAMKPGRRARRIQQFTR